VLGVLVEVLLAEILDALLDLRLIRVYIFLNFLDQSAYGSITGETTIFGVGQHQH